jgi:hypothetical protein
MARSRRLIVTTSGDRELTELTSDLQSRGFTPEQVLASTGIVIGRADDDAIDALRETPGVSDVSPDQEIDIGPPDAPVS